MSTQARISPNYIMANWTFTSIRSRVHPIFSHATPTLLTKWMLRAIRTMSYYSLLCASSELTRWVSSALLANSGESPLVYFARFHWVSWRLLPRADYFCKKIRQRFVTAASMSWYGYKFLKFPTTVELKNKPPERYRATTVPPSGTGGAGAGTRLFSWCRRSYREARKKIP